MKALNGYLVPIRFEREVSWTPEIQRPAAEETTPLPRRPFTLYRRSTIWNGIPTLVVVREHSRSRPKALGPSVGGKSR